MFKDNNNLQTQSTEKWVNTTFGALTLNIRRGPFGSSIKKAFFVESGYKVYEQQNAIKKNWRLGSYYIDESKYAELDGFAVHPGDYIVSCAGTLGELYRLPLEAEPGLINQALMRVRLNTEIITNKYFEYLFYYSGFRKKLFKDSKGTAMQNLAEIKVLKAIQLNIPPLPEQRAIVAKLETLLSELDNAVASLKQAKEQIKTYRQSVLKAAFTGRLTEEWRKHNINSTPCKITKSNNNLREYAFEYPDNWNIHSFIDVCSIDSNLVNPFEYLDYPHIAPDNIEKESGRLLKYNTIEEDKVCSPNHKFFKGQIIYSKIRPYLSKAVLIGFDGLCSADMYPLSCKINSKYVLFYILSSTFVNLASTAGTRSVLPKINQKELSIIPIPVPSKEEQEEIVSLIEASFSQSDHLNQVIDESLSKTEALKQSLLKQAFEGRLLNAEELAATRKAPDWEPAEKLLEKISETNRR